MCVRGNLTRVQLPDDVRDALAAVEEAARPLDAAVASRRLRGALDGWERSLVAGASEQGLSWDLIGRALGLSRQAAWEKYRQGRAAPARRLAGARDRQRAQLAEARSLRAEARSATGERRSEILRRAEELRARALAALEDVTETRTEDTWRKGSG